MTATGVVKRITVDELAGTANGKPCIKLKPGDHVVAAFPAPDGIEVVTVTSNAQALRFDAATVSIQGRGAGGVAGMKLTDGATVVGVGPVTSDDAIVLTQTDGQTAKVTDAAEVPLKGRATGGVRITKFRTEKRLEWAYVGEEDGLNLVVGTADAPTATRPEPRAAHRPPHRPGPGVQGHPAPHPRRPASAAGLSAAERCDWRKLRRSQPFLGRSLNTVTRSALGSLGSPRTRSPMMLRCTWSVPP